MRSFPNKRKKFNLLFALGSRSSGIEQNQARKSLLSNTATAYEDSYSKCSKRSGLRCVKKAGVKIDIVSLRQEA